MSLCRNCQEEMLRDHPLRRTNPTYREVGLGKVPKLGTTVALYRNLNLKERAIGWSVDTRVQGKDQVVAIVSHLTIKNARFVVQPGELNRARRTEQRNVHAWVEGTLVSDNAPPASTKWQIIRYNYTLFDTFVVAATEREFTHANWVRVEPDGKCYASVDRANNPVVRELSDPRLTSDSDMWNS